MTRSTRYQRFPHRETRAHSANNEKFGQYRIRTCGLFHVKETRYQLRQLSTRGLILTELSLGRKFAGHNRLTCRVRGEKKAAPRFELGDGAFAELCLTTWLCRQNFPATRGGYDKDACCPSASGARLHVCRVC